jgi:hypothetical protein
MTARSHETIRVGLRRIIRDPDVSARERMRAIERLMEVEGLLDAEMPKNKPTITAMSKANDNSWRELLALAEEKKTG